MTNLFGENKKQFNKVEKPKNEMYSLIYWYLNLIGQGNQIDKFLADRWKKAATSLLGKGTPEEVRNRVLESKTYYEKNNINWSLNAVATNWGKVLGSVNEKKEKLYQDTLEQEYARNNLKQKQLDDEWRRECERRNAKPLNSLKDLR